MAARRVVAPTRAAARGRAPAERAPPPVERDALRAPKTATTPDGDAPPPRRTRVHGAAACARRTAGLCRSRAPAPTTHEDWPQVVRSDRAAQDPSARTP